jgi:hypothetical protein
MKTRSAILILILVLGLGGGFLFSQPVHDVVQAELILKIIRLDRNIDRYGDPIKIGITSKNMLKIMKKNQSEIIKGKSVQVSELTSLDEIGNFNVIYIDTNWKDNYEAACNKAIAGKILMFCGSYSAVEKGQAGIAFRNLHGNPKIVINLDVVKAQGTNFPAELLKLTLVVKNSDNG